MGNIASALSPSSPSRKSKPLSFPGSTLLLENPLCGSLRDTLVSPVNDNDDDNDDDDHHHISTNHSDKKNSFGGYLRHQADHLCLSTDQEGTDDEEGRLHNDDDSLTDQRVRPSQPTRSPPEKTANPTSALFARALVSEVTNNPNTMTPKMMAEREKRLLKAQDAARKQVQQQQQSSSSNSSSNGGNGNSSSTTPMATGKPVGAPGGVGQPSILGSLAYVLGATASPTNSDTMPSGTDNTINTNKSILPPNSIQENRAQAASHQHAKTPSMATTKYSVTIGLSLSRRHSTLGHPDTVTRQTAFDFNELQDRQYKYVSSTDSSGWMAGGGERGGTFATTTTTTEYGQGMDDVPLDDAVDMPSSPKAYANNNNNGIPITMSTTPKAVSTPTQHQVKIAAPDTVHIPILQIDAESPEAVDAIIGALARGEIFIPHMAVLPEALSVNGISPPDLVVRFGCERNEDVPPEEWPNWCLEFMHNQLYEYFLHLGARWTKRPFAITLAKKVRWKTVKHMNRYFSHAERVIDAWREKGPQYLDPQLSYIEGGATPEEVGRPHGIYLMRNGIPTNYFPPNFDPPYTTKMTRSLLLNVLGKSWNRQRREWSSDPIPRLVTPAVLMASMCGCADPTPGFLATEVTQVHPYHYDQHQHPMEQNSNITDQRVVTRDDQAVMPTAYDNHNNGNDFDDDDDDIVAHPRHASNQAAAAATETFRTVQGDPVYSPMLHQQQQGARDAPESITRTTAADGQATSKGLDMSPLTAASMLMMSPQGEGSVLSPFGQGFVDDDEERVPAYPFEGDLNAIKEEKKMEDEPLDGHRSSMKQQQQQTPQGTNHISTSGADSPSRQRTRGPAFADFDADSPLESKGSGRGPTPEKLRIFPSESRNDVAAADVQAISPGIMSESDDDESGAFFHEQLTTPKSELPPQIAPSIPGPVELSERISTTASSSTVAHLNLSPAKLVQREYERKAREQFLNESSSPDAGMGSPSSRSASDRKAKKNKETIERERSLHIAMIAIAQDSNTPKSHDHIQKYLKDPRKVELAKALMESERLRAPNRFGMEGGSPSRSTGSPSLQRANSGFSLDYSVDDSSFIGDGSTTLAGSMLATDASVGTANSRRTHRSAGTNGTARAKKISEEDDGSVSVQESYSGSVEPVPNDDDLFAIGWAKALDAKSGSYYYFTLDRSKIVWDNPLAPQPVESAGSVDSHSLPSGSAMI